MKTNLGKMLKGTKTALVKHGPNLAMGFGIAGLITSGIMAVKATPKALAKINDEEKMRCVYVTPENGGSGYYQLADGQNHLSKLEMVKSCWAVYAPSVILAIASTALIINGNTVKTRRTAALATAYKLSETALTEYKDMVVETIGEKKEKTMQEKISAKKAENTPVQQVIVTSKGETLCLDTLGGRYFRSSHDTIKKMENLINLDLRNELYVSLNTAYSYLNLEPTDFGAYLGWNLDRDGYINVEIDSVVSPEGEPALTIRFSRMPQYDFDKFNIY